MPSCNSVGPVPSSQWFDRGMEAVHEETRRVVYMRGVFVCRSVRQSYVQEKWIEEFRIRCHKCDYRGTLTRVSVEEHMDEEIVRRWIGVRTLRLSVNRFCVFRRMTWLSAWRCRSGSALLPFM